MIIRGRKRKLPDEDSRHADSERKQVERALTAIKQHAPKTAAYLRENLVNAGSGRWFFTGDSSEWDTEREPEELDPDEIREQWLRERAPTPTPTQKQRAYAERESYR